MKLLPRLLAASALALGIGASADATVVTSIQIKTLSHDYLQIAEVQAFVGSTNVALGKTATATSTLDPRSVASNATDGNTTGTYPNIYHGNDSTGNDILTINLGGSYNLTSIAAYGRSDCCTSRDYYSYTLFNGTVAVGSGTLDARNAQNYASSVITSVPEPASWVMMIGGFGMIGATMRAQKRRLVVA